MCDRNIFAQTPSWTDCLHVAATIKCHPDEMKHTAERALLRMLVAFLKKVPL